VFAFRAPGPGTYRVRVAARLFGPTLTLASDDTVDQRDYAVALDYAAPFLPSQVDRVARAAPGAVRARYPSALQARGVAGCAALELVVDTLGAPSRRACGRSPRRTSTSRGPPRGRSPRRRTRRPSAAGGACARWCACRSPSP
jgi:hypothetical protein